MCVNGEGEEGGISPDLFDILLFARKRYKKIQSYVSITAQRGGQSYKSNQEHMMT